MKRILTIAGSDSGGGAGVQADLKTITVLGGFAMSVITSLTAQNTVEVRDIHSVPPDFVLAQLDAVATDIGVDAAKTGMLANAGIVEAVAEGIRRFRIRPLVADPVLVSKSGHTLLTQDARTIFIKEMLPLVDLLTPNLPEASLLCGFPVDEERAWRKAAQTLHDLGARAVLIKGGHGKGKEAKDLLFDGKDFQAFSAPRIETRTTHGTGCTYSAALATFLAQGLALTDAVTAAKSLITDAIRFGLPLGHGHGPTNIYAVAFRDADRYHVLKALEQAVRSLAPHPRLVHFAPEVQSNIGYALPHATTLDEVAAFPGRLVRVPEGLQPVRCPAFGVSRHIASIILAAMHTEPELRAAMNIRYTESILAIARQRGLKVATFDRSKEPTDVKAREGASLDWGITQAIQAGPELPDLIYDLGDMGKEPMIRILGKDPEEVVKKLLVVA